MTPEIDSLTERIEIARMIMNKRYTEQVRKADERYIAQLEAERAQLVQELDDLDDSPRTLEDLELDRADHKLDIERGDL